MGRFNLSAWAVRHPPLVLFLILMLAVAGTFSYLRLGRAEDPNFTIKVAVVTTIWPGATAQEMQDQVADPIEKKLQELPYFNKVTTYTKPSFTAMQVEFKDFTPPAEVPQLFYQLRKKLDDIRADLPTGLIGPSRQRRIRRRRFHPLHADGRRRRLRANEACGGDDAPEAAQGGQRRQGQPLWRSGREDLRRIQPRQARNSWNFPAGDLRIRSRSRMP